MPHKARESKQRLTLVFLSRSQPLPVSTWKHSKQVYRYYVRVVYDSSLGASRARERTRERRRCKKSFFTECGLTGWEEATVTRRGGHHHHQADRRKRGGGETWGLTDRFLGEFRLESGEWYNCQVLAVRSSVLVEVVEVRWRWYQQATEQPPLGPVLLHSQITSGSADSSEDRPGEGTGLTLNCCTT